MRKSCIIFFLSIASALFSQDFIVDYVDGIVDVREGNSWFEVLIGDTLTSQDTVRLSGGSILELSGPSSRFTLSEEGRYNLSNLGEAKVDTSGFGSLLSHKLKSMVTTQRRDKSAVMGVRASEASEDQPLLWMSSEAEEFIQSGKKELERSNIPAALDEFKTALDFAVQNDEELQADSARFYIGYVYNMMDKPGLALKHLNEIYPDPVQNYYGELIILKGNLLLGSLAYDTAIQWLENVDEDAVDTETIQTVKVLHGLAYIGKGDSKNAKAVFRQAREIDPTNGMGKYAAEQEKSL